MGKRTFLALFVVLCGIGGVAPTPVASASTKSRCAPTRAPETSYRYTTKQFRFTAVFELKGCVRNDFFDVDFNIEQSGVVMGQGMVGFTGCFGTRLKRCVVKFGLPHDPIERSTYDLEVSYRSQKGSETFRAGYVCTSAVATASCE